MAFAAFVKSRESVPLMVEFIKETIDTTPALGYHFIVRSPLPPVFSRTVHLSCLMSACPQVAPQDPNAESAPDASSDSIDDVMVNHYMVARPAGELSYVPQPLKPYTLNPQVHWPADSSLRALTTFAGSEGGRVSLLKDLSKLSCHRLKSRYKNIHTYSVHADRPRERDSTDRHTDRQTYINACIHASIRQSMHTYLHTYIPACLHYRPAYMHAYIHTLHTYIHTHEKEPNQSATQAFRAVVSSRDIARSVRLTCSPRRRLKPTRPGMQS